jgi:hypothetical protein
MCNGQGKVLPEDWIVVSSRAYEEGKLAFSATMSAVLAGRKKTPEHIAKVAAANTGKVRSSVARSNMSKAAVSRGVPSGFTKLLESRKLQDLKQRKPIAMLDSDTKDVIKVFDCMKEAAKYVNRNVANISVAVKKSTKCGNYFWKLV